MTATVTLPIPNSWYAVAYSSELKPGMVLSRKLAGDDIVVFRAKSGRACVMDAFCPHLGAHLGVGGTVVDETIRCPFHAFRFDTDGVCVATGYGTKPPPAARARILPMREMNGIVFAWYDSRDAAPTWEPPQLDTHDWTPLIYRVLDMHDHPQETVENGVDIGHFGAVHGYSEVAMRKDLVMDGPVFHVAYAARRPMPLLGWAGVKVDFDFHLDIHGLGFSLVTVGVKQFGIQVRLFITATPTVAERVNFGLALSLRHIESKRNVHPLAVLAPRSLLETIIAQSIHRALIHDVYQDKPIWEAKRHVHPPALAEGDGPVGKFRTWVKQFYYEDELPVEYRTGQRAQRIVGAPTVSFPESASAD
ncbi:MAG: Rieske 2Fe-2S domain-containing protein [Chloroflexi bacterium]|nr:Rieske 2Fe-2S domain-containing protein [Chloroflexota bacterium]